MRSRLPDWIKNTVKPVIEADLAKRGSQATLTISGKNNDNLIVAYQAVKTGTGYAAPTIRLEFEARSTGEPHHTHRTVCDIASVYGWRGIPDSRAIGDGGRTNLLRKMLPMSIVCKVIPDRSL